MKILTLSILLLFLIFFSAFFSAAEIGMMSINRYRLRHLAKKHHKQALRVQTMLQKPEYLLSVVLIGNTLANIIASTLATLLGQSLGGEIGVAIATLVLTLVIIVFSEMIPKMLGAMYSQAIAFGLSFPLLLLQKGFAPFVWLISSITNKILYFLGISLDKVQKESLTSEELRTVVNEAAIFLPKEHKSMLIRLLDLESASVEDVMIPKSEIVGIDLALPWQEVMEFLETTSYTRLALYENHIDTLLGMIHIRKVFQLALEKRLDKDHLLKACDKPYFVPEATPLHEQILHFQKMKKRSCFVVNEYGDLQGLVTLEDILEEVVGEFTTEEARFNKNIFPQKDGFMLIDASITLKEIKRSLDWQLPQLGPRTLSGLIIEYLGYIPHPQSCLRILPFQIDIIKVADNTIKTVKMRKVQ